MYSPRHSTTQVPSFYKQSPRKNVYKLSQPMESLRAHNIDPSIASIASPFNITSNPSGNVNRNSVRELEEWTHFTLSGLFKQEETKNLGSLDRHALQIQILDKSVNKLAEMIRIHCSDQSTFLLKLWSSAADLYSAIFKGLTKSVEELRVQVADRTIEAERWEDKYRSLKKQYAEEKSSQSFGVEKNNVIRQRDEEILLKEKEMLEFQDVVTALSIWFPNFSKFGKSVLSRYLPPLSQSNTDEVSIPVFKENLEKGESVGSKLKLAQGYLIDDLKRLEQLGIGLQISCLSDQNQASSALPFGLLGGQHQPALAKSSMSEDAGDYSGDRQHSKKTDRHSTESDNPEYSINPVEPHGMLLHLQELEAQSIKQQSEFEARICSLEGELQVFKRREKSLREQLLAIQKQTKSVIHCLPSRTFSMRFNDGYVYSLRPPTIMLSSDSILTELYSMLEMFSARKSVYSCDTYSSWTLDNFSNVMNGQSFQLHNLDPMKIAVDGGIIISCRLCSVIFQYYFLKCGSGFIAMERFGQLMWSIFDLVHTGGGLTNSANESLIKDFLKSIFNLDHNNGTDIDESVEDVEKVFLLTYWFRSIKNHTGNNDTLFLQDALKAIHRIFVSPHKSGYQERSVFETLIEDGLSETRPAWCYMSEKRQKLLAHNIKNAATLFAQERPVVSTFTLFNVMHQAVVQFRTTVINTLQEIFDFVASIVSIDPGNPLCMHLLLSCLFINPVQLVLSRQEITEVGELTSSIKFSHEMSALYATGQLNRVSFASLAYDVFSNFSISTLIELIDNDIHNSMDSLFAQEAEETNRTSNIFENKRVLETTGELLFQRFYDLHQDESFAEEEALKGRRFRKDVHEALKLASKRSRFTDNVQLQSILSEPCLSDESCLERILIHGRINFLPNLQIGLVKNISGMWFTLAAIMGLMPSSIIYAIRECIEEKSIDFLRGSTEVLERFTDDPSPCKLKVAKRFYLQSLKKGCFIHWKMNYGSGRK